MFMHSKTDFKIVRQVLKDMVSYPFFNIIINYRCVAKCQKTAFYINRRRISRILGCKGVWDKSLYNVHFDKNDRPYLTYGIVTKDMMKLYFLWQG